MRCSAERYFDGSGFFGHFSSFCIFFIMTENKFQDHNKKDHKEYFARICFPAVRIQALFSKLSDKIIEKGQSLIFKKKMPKQIIKEVFFSGLVTVS